MSQISSSYASSPWTPASDSSCCFWISAQGTAYSNGAAVTTLTDMSSAGLTVTAGGTGGGPTFTTNVVNGFPGILFNGTNHYLKAANLVTSLNVAVLFVGKGVSGTGFFFEQTTNAGSNNGFYMYSQTGQSTFISGGSSGSQYSYVNNVSSGDWWGTSPEKLTSVYINAAGADGTAWDGNSQWNNRKGGSSQFGSNITYAGTKQITGITARTVTDNFYIMSRAGSSVFAHGYVFEMAIFSGGTYNLAWAQQAENFVWNKWQI